MLRKHAFILLVLSLIVVGRSATARTAESAAPSYPDWAAAVAPAYPNCLRGLSGPVIPTMYGIAITDNLSTVVAWYKARVKGVWSPSEAGETWSVKSGRVLIQISKNFYDDSGKAKPGTRVALTRFHRR